MQHSSSQSAGAPLTEAQLGLWYAQRLDPSNPVFNIGHYTEIEGALDVERFRYAVDTALREADALAMRIVDAEAATPRQVLDERMRPRLQVVDLSNEADPAGEAQARMRRDMGTPLDPVREPMAAHVLYLLEPGQAIWYQRVHHVATDGYGIGLIDARVARLYGAAPDESDTGEPLAAYDGVLAEDADYRNGARRERDRAYWREAFAGMPSATSLAEGVPISSHHFLLAAGELSVSCRRALLAVQDRSGVSWPDVLTVLCAAYVQRHLGEAAEAVVGVPFMGRLGSRSARVPAMVMNVVPLRLRVDEDAELDAVLREGERGLRQARRHGRYRGELLRRDLGLLGGSRRLHGPLINVVPFEKPCALPGLKTRLHVLGAGPVDDLTVTFRGNPHEGGMRLTVEANPALYDESSVRAHLDRLGAFLENALAAPALAGVPTLTAAEHEYWVSAVNDTAREVPRTTLVALIDETMSRHASATALAMDGETLAYAELDRRSAALAGRLQRAGVLRGDRVAVALPRSFELVVALLAILRAGAAYVPLDSQQPMARLEAILDEAQPRVLLVPESAGGLPGGVPMMRVEAYGETAGFDPVQAPGPDDAAYVIYTSGSTGLPKGVVIAHDAIVNRLLWMQAHYGIGADERILQKTPATFDVSVWEFFLPLIAGATLVMAPPEAHRDPAWLAAIIREERVTTLHFVPSMLAAFLDEPSAAGLALRRVFCSGEALPAALRDRFHAVLSAELHNLYGPTEAAVDVSWWPASRDDRSHPVPIGFPVWNTALYVLDSRRRPLPPGVAGDLYIAGRQLAQGYLGRPELTAERFVPDPFAAPGARMYVTGDLAFWRDDGALVFLGRSDHQVKLRGQRIELGEIEHALATASGVAAVAVLLREDLAGGPGLVAYVVAADGATPDDAALREHAAARLPAVMLPTALVWLEALPLTANGKLDRRALPAPAAGERVASAPATGLAAEVAALFSEVLGESTVGADDDFFALGGHSLLAARLTLALRKTFGVACSLGAVFEHPTPARLASYLQERSQAPAMADLAAETGLADGLPVADDGAGFGPVIRLRLADGNAKLPALFCIHPAGGLSWCYGTLARAMPAGRAVQGLQSQALDPERRGGEPASLEAMAAEYVDTVLRLQPEGPCHLLGWSVGGIIAQAMAVELQRRHREVGVLALLDAYPSDCWRSQPEPPPGAVYKALLHIAGHDPASLVDVPLTQEGVIGFLRRSGHPLGELPPARLEGVIRAVAANNRLVRGHHHQRYDGLLLHFRAALDHAGQDLSPEYWRPYAAHLDVVEVPSLHAHLPGPEATAHVLPALLAALDGAERGRAG